MQIWNNSKRKRPNLVIRVICISDYKVSNDTYLSTGVFTSVEDVLNPTVVTSK